MSIEPWRKRGFVPDSDEDDDFDSLNTNKENVDTTGDDPDLEYIPISPSNVKPSAEDSEDPTEAQQRENAEGGLTTPSENKRIQEDVEVDSAGEKLAATHVVEELKLIDTVPESGVTSSEAKGSPGTPALGKWTPRPRRSTRKYGRSSSAKKTDDLAQGPPRSPLAQNIWDISSSPARQARSSQRPQNNASTPKHTPSVTNRKYRVPSRDSSPDELMVLVPSPRRPLESTANDDSTVQPPPNEASSDDGSSLSPALSNLPSPSPELSPEPLEHGKHETPRKNAGSKTSEDLPARVLLDLEAPEEFLTQSSQQEPPQEEIPPQEMELRDASQHEVQKIPQQQPVQRPMRSLRTHRPEQMNPYTYESAKYTRLMRAAGIRPVRVPTEGPRHRPAETTDESQEQDVFDPHAIRSSPPAEEYLPPSRPERRNERGTIRREAQDIDHQTSTIRRKQSTKRRKKARSGAWHDGTYLVSNMDRPQVITNPTHPASVFDLSVFDFPSSPPPSGSVSSVSKTPRAFEGFQPPPGLTPPPTTGTAVDSKIVTPGADEIIHDEDPGSAAGSDEETSSNSSSNELETAEEREIRRIQRQTRGVLPASWVRIEAQQRLQQQKASQSNRHAHPQRPDAKGVARKIVRKGGQPGRSSLMDFGDDDDSDGGSQSTGTPQPEKEAIEGTRSNEETVTRIPEFDSAFDDDQDADIFEDNRIDRMFAPASRTAGSREKGKGLKRPHSKESVNAKERKLKKARLQRQTRITDAGYGSRRAKQSSKHATPRLGILDAPDVATRSRKEQPQFLRVAARRARSRRDGGRRSPTRKFLQLASKSDTVDANKSLQQWRRGAIPQSNTRRSQPQHQSRKPHSIAGLSSTRKRSALSYHPRITSQFPIAEPDDGFSLNGYPVQDQSPGEGAPARAEASARSIETPRSTQAKKQGHQWIVQRNAAISSLQRNNVRPALGSLTESSASQPASRAMFRQKLTLLNRDYRHKQSSRTFKPSLTLDRFLSDTGPAGPSTKSHPQDTVTTSVTTDPKTTLDPQLQPAKQHQSRPRLRKKTPNRIDLNLDDFVQDQEPVIPISDESDVPTSANHGPSRPSTFTVGGLFNWQRSYSIDFGISHLGDGTYFHESTFIGSGEFLRSLHVLKRDFDQDVGLFSMPFKDHTLQWGPWNDKVSSEMGAVFDMIIDVVESSSLSASEIGPVSPLTPASLAYRSLISYVTEKLSFMDPVDRTGFLGRAMALVYKLRDPLAASIANNKNDTKKDLSRLASYNMVFCNQIRQLATHDLVNPSLGNEALYLAKLSAKDAIDLVLSKAGRTQIQGLLDGNKSLAQREVGIREDFPSAEAYVVTEQLLRSSEAFDEIFSELKTETCTKTIVHNQKDVRSLETGWHGLFMLLPFDEMDDHGIARLNSRLKAGHDNWNLVKKLLSPALDSYGINSATQPISYNAYCRTLFQRCHRLINYWGWRDCKPILDTLYDFFAQKTLYNLKLEESSGSPSFLDELDQNPSLEIRSGEPSFHTLLKIIASGLRFLSQRYDNKKIRNFAWRLLPNHGRMYPKDEPLRHEDLDALRNHHDLLCTLYWVVPNGYRPRLETIKDLVNPATSHRETCSINLRSWTRLVRFKLSTNEEVSGLEPFADWHSDFVNELRKQHQLARNEIEAQRKDGEWYSEQLIESTVSQNQRQIESLLSMALRGLLTAVEQAPSLEHAHRLISKTPFEALLSLFNPKVSRVNVVVSEALQIIVAYTRKDTALSSATESSAPVVAQPPEDDSQEYGDWDDIDAVIVQQTILSQGVEHVQYVLHPIISRFLSNCFGEDHCPDDAILSSAVDCWASVAQVLVCHGLKRWDNYLDPFGDESWARLRETVQTRKFSPQFLAVCIERDAQILYDCRMLIMGMWMSSLVERSSMLKFQHRLTEALLNGNPKDPLLQNLPFSKDKKLGRYNLTVEELNQRRISLISSILSNMREHVLCLETSSSRDFSVTKRGYSESLEQLMTAMKKNYRELGNGAVESARGAYVDFVHRIIQFLQELTSDIRPVDSFFTDSALFPLPSSDPRYIVAKLKRYEPKLSSKRELQTLIVFVQSITERAILESQQSHLVEQLHTAMTNTYEAGNLDKPTLRTALLRCVFPGYLELAFSSPAASLISRPVVQGISLVLKDLLYSLDTTDHDCVSSIMGIFDATFQSSYRALQPLSNRPAKLLNSTTLAMLVAFIEMVSSSLVVVDYIDRITDCAEQIVSYIRWFRDFAIAVDSLLFDCSSTTVPFAIPALDPTTQQSSGTSSQLPADLVATRNIAFEEHQSCLKNWSSHGGRFYYTRPGHESKEVIVEPDFKFLMENETEAKRAFNEVAEKFADQVRQLGFFPNESE
ncbi:hypothetical protein N7532_008431 [Penicillium argentinense]|uniref:Uncharacterized protein n=1 Tax=Penicillium argentinense TaxID=1131581 RepID=A0A9W9K2H9_9EURO|nr:uncharacterized protein N7532_008431 [Penicillium argentinense]KAJ5089747.1 hypothetical protein N7532_008431 [Penicillium argentinense]